MQLTSIIIILCYLYGRLVNDENCIKHISLTTKSKVMMSIQFSSSTLYTSSAYNKQY